MAKNRKSAEDWKASVELLGRIADAADCGFVVDSCVENVTDVIGPEPTDDSTDASDWWREVAISVESELDARLSS